MQPQVCTLAPGGDFHPSVSRSVLFAVVGALHAALVVSPEGALVTAEDPSQFALAFLSAGPDFALPLPFVHLLMTLMRHQRRHQRRTGATTCWPVAGQPSTPFTPSLTTWSSPDPLLRERTFFATWFPREVPSQKDFLPQLQPATRCNVVSPSGSDLLTDSCVIHRRGKRLSTSISCHNFLRGVIAKCRLNRSTRIPSHGGVIRDCPASSIHQVRPEPFSRNFFV